MMNFIVKIQRTLYEFSTYRNTIYDRPKQSFNHTITQKTMKEDEKPDCCINKHTSGKLEFDEGLLRKK